VCDDVEREGDAPDVADRDAGEELVRLGVAQRHDERLGAIVHALDDEASEDGGVSRRVRCAADPPLGRRDGRRVDDELVRAVVEGGGRLETGDVRAVCELCRQRGVSRS